MKLKTVLLVSIFTGCIVPILLAFSFFVKQDTGFREQQLLQQLNDIATIQHQRIKQYIDAKSNEINLIKNSNKLEELITKDYFFEYEHTQVKHLLIDVLQADPSIKAISLFNQSGQLILTTNQTLEHSHLHGFDIVSDTTLTSPDIQILSIDGSLIIDVFDRIDMQNKVVGFISVKFTTDELFKILSDHTGLGKSGEIVLAGTDPNGNHLYLMPTRHNSKLALQKLSIKDSENKLLIDTLDGQSSHQLDYLDYRKVPVIAIARHIPETGWGMIVKLDKDEAYQLINMYKEQSLYVLAFCLLGIYLISHILARSLSNPFNLLHQAILNLSKRDKSTVIPRIKIEEVDKIGQEFNRLAENLYETESHLHESIKELTRLNMELFSSAERFKRWRESNFIGIVQSNAQGDVLTANSTFLNMIGYSELEVTQGQVNWSNLTPEKFKQLDEKALNEAQVKGYWTPFEKQLQHKSGHFVPILIGGSIFQHDSQELILFVIDLTEKYQQLEELDQYRGIIENSNDLFAFVDQSYRFKAVNQKYLELHGLTREKVIGHYVYEILGEKVFYEKLKPKVDKALLGQVITFNEKFNFPNTGEMILHVTYTPYLDDSDQIIGFIFRGEDITELTVKEQLLQIKDEQQSHILSSMLEGVMTSDAQGKILSFNAQAELIFGYKESEVLGQSVKMLMPVEDAKGHDQKLERYLVKRTSHFIGNKLGQMVTAKHKTGRHFPIKLSIDELPKTENGETHFIASCQDLTEIEAQKSLLNRSLKMESLGKVAGGVAHDFNNILGIIMGYASLLSLGNDKTEKYANAIEKACKRGSKLTKSLLTFAKQRTNSQEQCDINKIIAENEDLLRTALTSRIELSLELERSLPVICVEKSQLEDLLLNMSINAKHAMKDVGTLKIGTEQTRLNQHKATMLDLPEGDYVKLWIEDNGCGIAKENLNKIFEPFYTTKAEMGNGLGLSQCYGFVKASGGSIDVLSTVNVGTKFIVYFPVSDHCLTRHIKESGHTQNIKLGALIKNVLVVDDEPEIANVNASILEQEGVDVVICTSANEALVQAKNYEFDFIVSDIIMPEMSGVELIKAIKDVKPNMKYLYVSGFTNEEVEDVHTLKKPYNKAEFIEAIYQRLS